MNVHVVRGASAAYHI